MRPSETAVHKGLKVPRQNFSFVCVCVCFSEGEQEHGCVTVLADRHTDVEPAVWWHHRERRIECDKVKSGVGFWGKRSTRLTNTHTHTKQRKKLAYVTGQTQIDRGEQQSRHTLFCCLLVSMLTLSWKTNICILTTGVYTPPSSPSLTQPTTEGARQPWMTFTAPHGQEERLAYIMQMFQHGEYKPMKHKQHQNCLVREKHKAVHPRLTLH